MRYHNITKDDMLNGDGLRVVLWVAGCSHCCKECQNLMEEIRAKYPGKTIWLYTGDRWEDVMYFPMMKYVDVLVDGEFKIDLKDTKLLWKGSQNQRVIDVRKSLAQTDPSIPVLYCEDYA